MLGVSRERFVPENQATSKVSKLRSRKGVFVSLGRVSSWTPFRKTYGNFCFKKHYGVSLFRLATGNVGRGKRWKKIQFVCWPIWAKREKLGSVFFHKSSPGKPLPSSAVSEPRLRREVGPGDSPLAQTFLQHFRDFAGERCKIREMSRIRATV